MTVEREHATSRRLQRRTDLQLRLLQPAHRRVQWRTNPSAGLIANASMSGWADLSPDLWASLGVQDWYDLPVGPQSNFAGFGQKGAYLDPETQLYLMGSGGGWPGTTTLCRDDSSAKTASDWPAGIPTCSGIAGMIR